MNIEEIRNLKMTSEREYKGKWIYQEIIAC
jgi:hypothetical protein